MNNKFLKLVKRIKKWCEKQEYILESPKFDRFPNNKVTPHFVNPSTSIRTELMDLFNNGLQDNVIFEVSKVPYLSIDTLTLSPCGSTVFTTDDQFYLKYHNEENSNGDKYYWPELLHYPSRIIVPHNLKANDKQELCEVLNNFQSQNILKIVFVLPEKGDKILDTIYHREEPYRIRILPIAKNKQ